MNLTGLVFSLAFFAGCGLAFARHPIFGLITYVGTLFLSPPLRWWGQGVFLHVRWAALSALVTLLSIFLSKQLKRPLMPLRSHGVVWLFVFFVAWLGIQMFMALAPEEHSELLSYYVKFALVILFVYRCVDSEENLRLLLWSLVLCCFYFGWIAYTTYEGGRFEGFGGAGIGEANAGALTLVIGILAGAALFLAGRTWERVVLVLLMPIIVNGLVTTISRSGFLALMVGGLVFNFYTPKNFRKQVRGLSILAGILFLMLTGPSYWNRIQSIKTAGAEQTQSEDDGGRLELIAAQWRMFTDHPMGCGAMCTAVLSPNYLDDRFLTGYGDTRVRASHNTAMTMLVEHGIFGAIFYAGMLIWIARKLLWLWRELRGKTGFLPTVFPAIAGIFAAMTVGDMFVTYAKFEIRFWFIALLMVIVSMVMAQKQNEPVEVAPEPETPKRRGVRRPPSLRPAPGARKSAMPRRGS